MFGGGIGFGGYFLLPSYFAALVCCKRWEEKEFVKGERKKE